MLGRRRRAFHAPSPSAVSRDENGLGGKNGVHDGESVVAGGWEAARRCGGAAAVPHPVGPRGAPRSASSQMCLIAGAPAERRQSHAQKTPKARNVRHGRLSPRQSSRRSCWNRPPRRRQLPTVELPCGRVPRRRPRLPRGVVVAVVVVVMGRPAVRAAMCPCLPCPLLLRVFFHHVSSQLQAPTHLCSN